MEKVFDFILKKYQRLDVLVNNAGVTADAMLHKMTLDQWNKALSVNLTARSYAQELPFV